MVPFKEMNPLSVEEKVGLLLVKLDLRPSYSLLARISRKIITSPTSGPPQNTRPARPVLLLTNAGLIGESMYYKSESSKNDTTLTTLATK